MEYIEKKAEKEERNNISLLHSKIQTKIIPSQKTTF